MKNVAGNSRKQKLSTMIFGFTLLLMSVANISFAKDVTLTWDANQEADVAGYKLYYGTSPGTYTGTEANIGPSPINFDNMTSATFVGLDDTKSHYFTVTAYNVNGEESAYAREVNAPARSNDDLDGDGYDLTVDCDDYKDSINPGATEIPCDSIDQNCSGADSVNATCTDSDGDGSSDALDCRPNDANIFPGATEIPCDDIDQDCSGADTVNATCSDSDKDGISDNIDQCPETAAGVTVNANGCEIFDETPVITDADGDGFDAISFGGKDCNDKVKAINPDATDICGDGIDQDCSNGDAVCPVDPLKLLSPTGGEQWSSSSAQTISWNVGDTPSPVDIVVIEHSRNGRKWKTLKTLSGTQAQATNAEVMFPTTRKSKDIKVKVTVKNSQGVVMGKKNSGYLTLTR